MDEEELKYRKNLKSQVRNAYGKVVYSYTSHWKQQNIYSNTAGCIRIWEIVLSSISTTGLVSFLISDEKWVAVIGTIFSALSLGLNLLVKEKNIAN